MERRKLVRKLLLYSRQEEWIAWTQSKKLKSEKCLNSGYVLKEEPVGFAEGLEVACERNREVEDGSIIFGLRSLTMGFPFTEMGEPGRRASGEKGRQGIHF